MKKNVVISLFIISTLLLCNGQAFAQPKGWRPPPIPTAAIQGRVIDSETGEGISGAKVTAKGWQGDYYSTTTADGYYRIENVNVPRLGILYTVTASAQGYKGRSDRLWVRPGATYTVNFSLQPDRPPIATIKGRVTDKDTGEGIAEAKVTAQSWWWRYHGKWRYEVYSDSQGYYEIKNARTLHRGIYYKLSASKKEYRTQYRTLFVRPGITYTVDFSLIPVRPPVLIKIISPQDEAEIKEDKLNVEVYYRICGWERYKWFDGWHQAGKGRARFWWFRRTIDLHLDGNVAGSFQIPFWQREGTHTFAISDYSPGEHELQSFIYLDRWKRIILAKSNIVHFTYVYDTTPPDISNLIPPDSSIIKNPRPEISAIVTDTESGVDPGSIQMALDSQAVTPSYDPASGKISYTPASALAEGLHNVDLSVKDYAKNEASQSWAFTVDTVLPAITDLSPPEGTLTDNPKPPISAIVTDATSGVDPLSIILAIDGTQVTHTYDEGTGKVSYTPADPLSDGYHEIILTVRDRATNEASAIWHFTIDTIPPVVNITLPVGGSLFNYSPITVTGTIDDVEALLLVRGAKAIITDNTFTAEGIILCSGENIIKAEAIDLAGNIGEAFVTVTLERPLVPKQTNFTYDDRGNVLTITDPLGNVNTFTYEPRYDLVTSITDSLGHQTLYSYDDNGNLIQVTDALGNITSYNYDSSGNLIQLTDARGNSTFYQYDTYGNLIKITDALGNETAFEYDILGNVKSLTDARLNSTTYEYDGLNRLTKIIYPDFTAVSYAYDAVGNRILVTDPNNNSTNYVYDVADRLIEVRDALNDITSYAYDKADNRVAITDANNNVISYFYDQLNRLIKVITPSGKETLYDYDAGGNRTSTQDAKGQIINYAYDANNRLLEIDYPDNSKVAFDYDLTGKRIGMLDSRGIAQYKYDEVNRLVKVVGVGGRDDIGYAYDGAGKRIGMTDQDNGVTAYEYDQLNRLVKLTDPYGKTTAYGYDAVSNLTQMAYPNNTQVNYAFDNLNRLLALTNEGPSGTISSYAYDYNPAGMRTAVTLANGDRIDYGYDVLNRLTNEARIGSLAYNYGYSFDAVGNRLSLVKDGVPVNYTYNDENQLLSSTDGITYTYDNNGNLIQKVENGLATGYGYDYENRLTGVSYADSSADSYVYDGVGKRVQTIENGEVTNYLYDGLNAIIEKNDLWTTQATYTRGLSYGGGIGSIISSNGTYYHYDGIGTVTDLTDGSGQIIQNYIYDAYGNLLTPQAPSPHGFSTKEYSAKSNFVYFGARYYDPRVGRFITPDPWNWCEDDERIMKDYRNTLNRATIPMIGAEKPMYFNRYIYVLNNPVNRIDWIGKQGGALVGPSVHPLDNIGGLIGELQESADERARLQERIDQHKGIYDGLYFPNLDERTEEEKQRDKQAEQEKKIMEKIIADMIYRGPRPKPKGK